MRATVIKRVAFTSISVLITFTLLGSYCSCRPSNPHQPNTFSQMQELVTPNDPVVQNALAEAMADLTETNSIQSGNTAAFSRLRDWVASHIEYVSDEKTHRVEDYWQTPEETLSLRTGDCEDYAILLVSLLRAYSVPEDQAYVAVGYELNEEWHAWVVERYYNGIWRILTVEVAADASYLDNGGLQTETISYCFNDRQAFQGLPQYPPGYIVPELPHPPTTPAMTRIRIKGTPSTRIIEGSFTLTNPSYDEAKERMGRLYLPAYLPGGYHRSSLTVQGNYSIVLKYAGNQLYDFMIFEDNAGVDMSLPAGHVEEVTMRGTTGYLIYGTYYRPNSTSTQTLWRDSGQVSLYFPLDGWVIHIVGMQSTPGLTELIKIAESLQLY